MKSFSFEKFNKKILLEKSKLAWEITRNVRAAENMAADLLDKDLEDFDEEDNEFTDRLGKLLAKIDDRTAMNKFLDSDKDKDGESDEKEKDREEAEDDGDEKEKDNEPDDKDKDNTDNK